jgi:hypothetical protein
MQFSLQDLKDLLSDNSQKASEKGPMIGRHCVVRTYSAGVHIGDVVAKDGTNIHLTRARRLWKWGGAFTLSEVATKGIDPKESRMGCEVEIELTQAIELIPTTAKARDTFDKVGNE